MSEVYITRLSKFLPNDPISNDQMENYLGRIDGRPSKAKGIILRNYRTLNLYLSDILYYVIICDISISNQYCFLVLGWFETNNLCMVALNSK